MAELRQGLTRRALEGVVGLSVAMLFGAGLSFFLGLWDDIKSFVTQPTSNAVAIAALAEAQSHDSEAILAAVQGNQSAIEGVSQRITMLEANFQLPDVVTFDTAQQVGTCNVSECKFRARIIRTEYGADCGVPDVRYEFRMATGETFFIDSMENSDGWGALRAVTIIMNFDLPGFVPVGRHEINVQRRYPDCVLPGEPIWRDSPWFSIDVTENGD